MKPHSSTHHMLPSHGTAGIDLIALGAGKDPAVTDAASHAFASIMAQQLASSTETATNPVNSKVLDEAPTLEVDQSVEKHPDATELNLPMSVDMLGFHVAPSQMISSDLKTLPMETGINQVDGKLTEAGTPLVVDQLSTRLTSPTDIAQQVPPDVIRSQPQQSTMADAGVSKVNETTLPSNKGKTLDAQWQGTQLVKPLKQDETDDVSQMKSVASQGGMKDVPVATTSLLNENASTTANLDASRIEHATQAQPTEKFDENPLKQVPFTMPEKTSEVVRNDVALKMREAILAPQSPTPLDLTLSSLLVQVPDLPASTVETFGMRMRLPQAPKLGMQQPTFDQVANQTMSSQSGLPLAMATAISQPTDSTPSTLIADKSASVPVTSKEVVSDVKPLMDRPSDALPAWLQSNMLTPMTPAVAVAHESAVMHQRVGTAAFADEFVGQVNVWVKKASDTGAMTAELHLNPVEMGPVQIRIEIDGSNAQVSFVAQHLETRQAIEASMGALSNTLQEAGIQLSGSGVSDQSAQQQASSGFGSRGDDAPRPWQSPQQSAVVDTLIDAKKPFLDEVAPWERPRAGQNASGLDLYA